MLFSQRVSSASMSSVWPGGNWGMGFMVTNSSGWIEAVGDPTLAPGRGPRHTNFACWGGERRRKDGARCSYGRAMKTGCCGGGEPQFQIRFLEGAEFDAAVDAFDGVLEGQIGGGYFVRGEEVLHAIAGIGGAEGAC